MMIVDNKEIIVKGRLIKTAEFKEDWDEDIENPEAFIKLLKSSGVKADIFTFMQRLPESKPRYKYYMEWDSLAAIPITSYENWFKYQLHQNPRNKMRIAEKKGVAVKLCDFNDELVRGITTIYNETPIRQGKHFKLYKMDFDTTKKAHITFLERAYFLGAFFKNEFIGFIKLVPTGKYMRTMGILAKIAHRDKAPMNLLVAKAVEICAMNRIQYLVYGKYNYGRAESETLKEFKRYLGFESIILPRYYIPLNAWGKLMMKMNLHHDIVDILPRKLVRFLLELRNKFHVWKYSRQR